MNNDLTRLPVLFVVLCAFQVFVLNHCQLFGCATPLFYVYYVLTMRKGMPRWGTLVLAFMLGITLDIFDNTPGITAASLTLLAMCQPRLLELFISREGEEDLRPSILSLGLKPFFNYTLISVLLYCSVYYTLELMSFLNWLKWTECVIGSSILTVALIMAIATLGKGKAK